MGDLVSSLDSPIGFPQIPGVYSVFITQGQPGGLPIPSADYVGKFAMVSDLFGYGVNDRMLCTAYTIGGVVQYRWRPVRDSFPNVGSMTVDSNIILTALQSPTIIRLTGTMIAARTITPSTVNAYPGLSYELRYDGLLSVFGLSLAGVNGILPFTSGQNKIIYFDGTQFVTKAG